ncbi:PfkB family carbohydrate kinase [Anaerosporobacter sp.]|uniref:PfkB family carbohydrate kinase n=1 Tax=Anaerosporobacter sp. TaxID=1872529 RepID=UPI00286F85B0|nr:PfkB family carbohydrate kinase [Anaerosporobacter sp.]
MKKTLVIGSTVLDIIIQIDHLPKTSEDIHIKGQQMALGGCAYNAADIMRKFDVPYTLLSPIGTGRYASIVESMLQEKGMESAVNLDTEDNGFCLCMVEKDGERTFVVHHGVEYRFQKEWVTEKMKAEHDSVYIAGLEIEERDGLEIIEFIEENPEYQVYFAPGPRLSKIGNEKLDRIFARKPIIHLNEEEAMELGQATNYEEAAKAIHAITNNTVIITLGKNGAYYYENGQGNLVKGEEATVVDTIGAGDAHIGTIMASMELGLTMGQAIERANKVSAAVVSVQGSSLTEQQFSCLQLKKA